MDYDIREMVERFCERRHVPHEPSTVRNLFGLDRDNEYTFLSLCGHTKFAPSHQADLKEVIARSIRDSIQEYSSNKKTAINLYRAFVAFVKEKYNIEVAVDFPTVAVWDSLERQLAIIKLLHDGEQTVQDLGNHLLVSTRTIEKDLKMLRESDSESLQLMGQSVKIPCTRRNGEFLFKSTAHPLFLMSNLAQVITILEGLGKQAQSKEYENFALSTAVNIWTELSNYARNRIFRLADTLDLDQTWLNKIQRNSEKGASNLFRTEEECSGEDTIMRLLKVHKSGEKCFIEYEDEAGQTVYVKDVRIASIGKTEFTYRSDNTRGILKKDQVLRITTNPIELAN